MLHVANMTTFAKLYDEIVAMLEGTGNIGALQSATEAVIAGGMRDPEGLFMLALRLAHFGGEDRAVEILADAVHRGYFPYDTFTREPVARPAAPSNGLPGDCAEGRASSPGSAGSVHSGRRRSATGRV